MKLKKYLYITIGLISLGFGILGIILPLLPAFPFLLLTAYCFAKSSTKLHNWFLNTSIYHQYLKSYVDDRTMSKKVKIKIMCIITLLMSFGFVMMHKVFIGQIILFLVWLLHLYIFIFKIKTSIE